VIANAVLHARTVVTVTVVRTGIGTVRIDVSDGSPHVPERRQADAEDTDGRGIGLLDALAASWSVRMNLLARAAEADHPAVARRQLHSAAAPRWQQPAQLAEAILALNTTGNGSD
jgi:hypothetical protein